MAKKKTSSKASKGKTKKSTKTTKAKAKGDVLLVDFSETEGRGGSKGGRRPHWPEDDYRVKVTKAERGESSQKKTPYVRVTFKAVDGAKKGKTIWDDWYITDSAAWRFRNLLEGAGLKVPSKKTKVDIRKLVGCTLGITVEDDVYEDDEGNERVTSRITDTFLESELDEVEEDLDADLDEDEDEEEDDEEEEDEDEDEDEEEDEEEDEDEEDLEELDVDEL